MAEYPALPLFTDAFLGDTLHLTAAQIGAYMMMLMAAWRAPDCTLPNDDTFLARVCRMDKRTWQANKGVILAFWHVTDDAKLFQKRLKDERIYVEDKRNKNVAAGNASALKRKKRHSTGVATCEQPKTNQPTPTPILSKEDKSSSDKPHDVSAEAWEDFLAIRKKKKAQNTEFALKLVHDELAKLKEQGFSPQAVVEQSIRSSWIDVFPLRNKTPVGKEYLSFEEKAKKKTDQAMEEYLKRYAQPS
jgi:uncharacterized protein YdaU (DUF1376 family)